MIVRMSAPHGMYLIENLDYVWLDRRATWAVYRRTVGLPSLLNVAPLRQARVAEVLTRHRQSGLGILCLQHQRDG